MRRRGVNLPCCLNWKGKFVIILLRRATQADADAVADVYLASRKALDAFAPLAHTNAEVRRWIADRLIPSGAVTVADTSIQVVGMMATSHENGCTWINQLYVMPALTGRNIGALLLAHAKAKLGYPIRLYTFRPMQAQDGSTSVMASRPSRSATARTTKNIARTHCMNGQPPINKAQQNKNARRSTLLWYGGRFPMAR